MIRLSLLGTEICIRDRFCRELRASSASAGWNCEAAASIQWARAASELAVSWSGRRLVAVAAAESGRWVDGGLLRLLLTPLPGLAGTPTPRGDTDPLSDGE